MLICCFPVSSQCLFCQLCLFLSLLLLSIVFPFPQCDYWARKESPFVFVPRAPLFWQPCRFIFAILLPGSRRSRSAFFLRARFFLRRKRHEMSPPEFACAAHFLVLARKICGKDRTWSEKLCGTEKIKFIAAWRRPLFGADSSLVRLQMQSRNCLSFFNAFCTKEMEAPLNKRPMYHVHLSML